MSVVCWPVSYSRWLFSGRRGRCLRTSTTRKAVHSTSRRSSCRMTNTLDEVFAPGGPIERALSAFETRPGQIQMAQLIERGFLEGMHTIVEAGTGVGKSLAYLVPAMRSGKKIVISTGTIALQEQLYNKDIPLVTRALGLPAR